MSAASQRTLIVQPEATATSTEFPEAQRSQELAWLAPLAHTVKGRVSYWVIKARLLNPSFSTAGVCLQGPIANAMRFLFSCQMPGSKPASLWVPDKRQLVWPQGAISCLPSPSPLSLLPHIASQMKHRHPFPLCNNYYVCQRVYGKLAWSVSSISKDPIMSGKQTPRCEARLCQPNKGEEMIQEILTKTAITWSDVRGLLLPILGLLVAIT